MAESQTAESRTAALARNSSGAQQQLQLPSSSNNAAYRYPIAYDKLTGATNNQINDVLGAGGKQPTLIGEYPIDHYQQQQQQQQQAPALPLQHQQYHQHQNLLADPQQQQRHRQQMLDRQMLFGPAAPVSPFGPPLDFSANQSATNPPNYYPDPALYRHQKQPAPAPPLPMMQPPPFSMPPPPAPQSSQREPPTNNQHQQAPIRPPYAHLAPPNMPPMSQYEYQQQPPAAAAAVAQQQQQQQQHKPAAQSRVIPLNSRIDPTSTSSATPPASSQQLLAPQQMVLASNQAPPKTLNSIQLLAPPPQQPSRESVVSSGARLAAPASTAVPSCVRQQVDQQQQQQQQAPATNDNGTLSSNRLQMPVLFCNIDPEYPTKDIMRALEMYAQEQRTIEHLLPQLLIQLHIQAQPARQPGGNHQLLTLDQLQSSLVASPSAPTTWQNNSSSSGSNQQDNKQFPSANFEQMCRSTIQMAQPRRAKNLAGQWKAVVNLPGHKYRGIAISQMVRVEECSAPLSECATPSKPSAGLAKSSCLQHYENQRLVAWTPQQGLHLDTFRMPVACSCHIRRT